MSIPRPMLAASIALLGAVMYRRREDLGIAMLELLAYLADRVGYYAERIANEAYLETARERDSVKSLGRLVDYESRPGYRGAE